MKCWVLPRTGLGRRRASSAAPPSARACLAPCAESRNHKTWRIEYGTSGVLLLAVSGSSQDPWSLFGIDLNLTSSKLETLVPTRSLYPEHNDQFYHDTRAAHRAVQESRNLQAHRCGLLFHNRTIRQEPPRHVELLSGQKMGQSPLRVLCLGQICSRLEAARG